MPYKAKEGEKPDVKEAYDFLGINPDIKPDEGNPFEEHLRIDNGEEPEKKVKSKKNPKNEEQDSQDIDEEEGEEGEDNEDEDNEDVEEEDDEESEEDQDEYEEEEPESNDTVPLKTHLSMKAELKALKKQNLELAEKFESVAVSNTQATLAKKYEEMGLDVEIASSIASDIAKLTHKGDADSKFEDNITQELDDLSNDDLFYDAIDYKGQVIKRIRDFKKKGITLSVEDALLNIIGTTNIKSRMKSTKTKQQAKNRLKMKRNGTKSKKPSTSSRDVGKPPKNYGLDSDDMKAYRELQKAQPWAKWTMKKYAAMKTK